MFKKLEKNNCKIYGDKDNKKILFKVKYKLPKKKTGNRISLSATISVKSVNGL